MLRKTCFLMMLAMPAAAGEIKVAQTRALMTLSDELTRRYGYLVTYEDAPADASREISVEKRADGRQFRHIAWKLVTFQVQNSPSAEPEPGQAPVSPRVAAAPRPAEWAKMGPDLMEPLLKAYNSSGNPGHFSAIYDGDSAHLVEDERSVDGKLVAFQPISSTVIFVNLQEGSCWELFKNLFDEVQQIRGVTIVQAFPAVDPWDTRTCSIVGHDLPARQALMQLLAEVAPRPRVYPDDRFLWTLVHDPNTDAFFFSTQTAPRPAEPASPPAKPQAQEQVPAQGAPNRFVIPVAPPLPIKKQ